MVLNNDSADDRVIFKNKIDIDYEKLPHPHNIGLLDCTFYEECYFGHVFLKINCFVYVLNAKTSGKDHVAKILYLYMNKDGVTENKALVQWYIRPKSIIKHIKLQPHISIDTDNELVMDMREPVTEIPIESISGKFRIIGCKEEQKSPVQLNEISTPTDTYVCRYKIIKTAAYPGNYCLVPLVPVFSDSNKQQTNICKSDIKSKEYQHEHIVDNVQILEKKKRKGNAVDQVSPTILVNNSTSNKIQINDLENGNIDYEESYEIFSPKKKPRSSQTDTNFNEIPQKNACRSLTQPLNYLIEHQDNFKFKLKATSDSHNGTQIDNKNETPAKRTRSKSQFKEAANIEKPEEFIADSFGKSPISNRMGILRLNQGNLNSPTEKNNQKNYINNDNIKRGSISTTPKRTPKIKKEINSPVFTLNSTRSQSEDNVSNTKITSLQQMKACLHVSATPKNLPCREHEFNNILSFIERKILDKCGGCMYISGVPGTGKTATVTEVIRTLQLRAKKKIIPSFEFVSINGMKLTEPRQAYVQIYRQLTGKTIVADQACSLIEKRFIGMRNTKQSTTVLLVDELDILCNRRQDVVYNILDWPTKVGTQIIVVTIANTMDLPERVLLGRVTSRLGLTRLTFQPYSHKQLQEVVMNRLSENKDIFKSEAIQLVARKVASVSGDCRRALDICRRAIEIAELHGDSKENAGPSNRATAADIFVSIYHVQQAFGEMISSTKVQAIKGCSKMEQFFLQAVEAEVGRTGVEETTFLSVYTQFVSILTLMGHKNIPPPGRALLLSMRLGASKLIICEGARNGIHQKIVLNITNDDIHYALNTKDF